jgi:hypothetical protein
MPAAAQMFPAKVEDKPINDNLYYLYEQILKVANLGLTGSYLPLTTAFAGDVTGTYTAMEVADNSHNHNPTTLTGVIVSTATIQVQINAIAVDTGTLTANMTAVILSTSPLSAFTVVGSSVGIGVSPNANTILHLLTQSSNNVSFRIGNDSTQYTDVSWKNGNYLGFSNATGAGSNIDTLVIKGNKVGIGSIAPAATLNIVGPSTSSIAPYVIISSRPTSMDSMCFGGAVASLPVSGFARGCLIYLTTDPTKIYLSTETVVSENSWLAK